MMQWKAGTKNLLHVSFNSTLLHEITINSEYELSEQKKWQYRIYHNILTQNLFSRTITH